MKASPAPQAPTAPEDALERIDLLLRAYVPTGTTDWDIARQAYEALRSGGAPASDARDAARYRWLTEDHPNYKTRQAVENIGLSIGIRGKGATDAAIDAAMKDQP